MGNVQLFDGDFTLADVEQGAAPVIGFERFVLRKRRRDEILVDRAEIRLAKISLQPLAAFSELA